MGIADYLKQRAHELEESSSRIRDYRVFDFNYIPDQPHMRQEIKPIVDACLRYAQSGIPNHLFIFGTRGCGKTLTMRYLGRLLHEQHHLDVIYANCRQHNTSFKILAYLLGVRPRGCSIDELWQRFCRSHTDKTILILDEVDLISDKDSRREILYLISRSSANHMAVLLSNHPKFLSSLDESVRSTLQPELVHFRNYDAVEILHILKDRAHAGLRHVTEATLAQIAGLTVRETNSDARVAIKTLYYAALADAPDLPALFHRARRDLVADVLADLNDRNLLILKAATELPEPFVKAVYAQYRHLSAQHRLEPCSYVYLYSSLSYLQSIGLIVLTSTKVGRAYTNRIQVLFQLELLDRLCGERFG